MAKVVLKVTEELLKFHTWQMQKHFVVKYQKLAEMSKATGDNSVASSKLEEKQCEHIYEFLATYDYDNVITDLHSLNRKPDSTKFNEFWDPVHQLYSEYEDRAPTFTFLLQ